MKQINISDFINTKYREFWNESNLNRNSFLPEEQLMVVARRIIWACYKVGMSANSVHKTVEISGETAKFHIAGDSSISDSVKGLATTFRRQPATRILRGIGNFGVSAGDPGAASRYTSVAATPLLLAIFKDLPFCNMVIDETGKEQPEWVSCPLPMMLINGTSQIGVGKAAYFDERLASEVIDWIDMLQNDENAPLPKPYSSTGCHVWTNPANGYTVYDAVIEREGKYDIIKALPPKKTSRDVIAILKNKLPKAVGKKIIDGSGENKPTWIMVPKGYLSSKDDYMKFGLRTARIESPYIWDTKLNTLRLSSHKEVARIWFEARKVIVTKRLNKLIENNENSIHKIDLIRLYVEKEMNKWDSKDIEKELGEDDANIVLSQRARVFLPENLNKNEITKNDLIKENKKLKNDIKNISKFVLDEARDIIKKQEEFFAKEENM